MICPPKASPDLPREIGPRRRSLEIGRSDLPPFWYQLRILSCWRPGRLAHIGGAKKYHPGIAAQPKCHAVRESAGEPLGAEDLCPLVEGQVGGDEDRSSLVALAKDLEQQLCAGLGERDEAEFVDDDEL